MSDKIALVGDTHGNMSWLCNDVIPYAQKTGCEQIIQLGDFGFIFPGEEWPRISHKLDRILDRAGIDLAFLPGNHEDHLALASMAEEVGADSNGHYALSRRITYLGRYSAWDHNGWRIAAVGGAVSIDQEWRLDHRRRTGTAIWWPEEVLTEDEHRASLGLGKVDVLLTHDAPSSLPLSLKVDFASTANRQRMTDLGRELRPKTWFHGHYHEHVVYPFHHDDGLCEVRGLDRDFSPRVKGVAILHVAPRLVTS